MRSLRALVILVVLFTGTIALADSQRIAPGRGDQGVVAIDTGADGLCNSTASGDDFQLAPVGAPAPNQPAIECDDGTGFNDGIVNTTAVGDDRQLVAVGGDCTNGQVIIDTGPDGVANTTAGGDDVLAQAVGTSPSNAPCIDVGTDGIANSTVAGDDVQLVPVSTGNANAPVVKCGPNKIAETPANNFVAGDDVQVTAVGNSCGNANTIVVNSGADGIAQTRAQGPDLMLKTGKRVKARIPKGAPTVSKQVKLQVNNIEFGATAPTSRDYKLVVDEGACPGGSVSQVDADGKTAGLQATASVPKDGKMKGSFVVTLSLDQANTVSKKIPTRCLVDVTAVVADPNGFTAKNPDDDDQTDDNNRAQFPIEVFDANDL
jgi:hypothetical protein